MMPDRCRKNKKRVLATLAVSILPFFPACGSAPRTDYFTLHLSPAKPVLPTESALASKYGPVAVRDVTIASEYRTDRLVYRPSPYEVGYYNYARWAIAPEANIRRALRRALSESRLLLPLEETVAAEQGAAFILETHVDRLDEARAGPDAWEAHLSISFKLIERETKELAVFHQADIRRPVETRAPLAIVRALSEALDEAVAAFLEKADRFLARRKRS